jgi:hypothetical protein
MTSVSTPSKTQGTTLLSLQSIAASTTVVGSEVDVTGKFAGVVFIHFGRTTTSAPGSGVSFRIEAADKSSGGNHWYPLTSVITGIAACNGPTNTSTSGAAQTVSAITGFVAQDICCIAPTTVANTEWARMVSSTGSVLTMEETIAGSHSTGNTYNKAEMYAIPLDLSGIGRLRVVADGSAHNQAFRCEAFLNTLDSVSST